MNRQEVMASLVAKLKDQEGFFQEENFISCDNFELLKSLVPAGQSDIHIVCIKKKAGERWYKPMGDYLLDKALDLKAECGRFGVCYERDQYDALMTDYIERAGHFEVMRDNDKSLWCIDMLRKSLECLHKVKDDEFMAWYDDGIFEIHKHYSTHYNDEGNSVDYRIAIAID